MGTAPSEELFPRPRPVKSASWKRALVAAIVSRARRGLDMPYFLRRVRQAWPVCPPTRRGSCCLIKHPIDTAASLRAIPRRTDQQRFCTNAGIHLIADEVAPASIPRKLAWQIKGEFLGSRSCSPIRRNSPSPNLATVNPFLLRHEALPLGF